MSEKSLFIAEKPSVAREFASALKLNTVKRNGYLESNNAVITWCVGHLVTMAYPDAYDEALKKWSFDTIPFIPDTYKYQVIDAVKDQFEIVSGLLNREDVTTIYVCTDSGREGEYIYRLVEQMAHVEGKTRKRVWIDSQTEDEIRRGIKEAKDISAYDNLSASAYLRAKEDYLMGINFSRALTLKYGYTIREFLNLDKSVISVGRVMTCVLGMVVNREREVRDFVKIPFYRILSKLQLEGKEFDAEFKALEGSNFYNSPVLYKENGFKEESFAMDFTEKFSNKSLLEDRRTITFSEDEEFSFEISSIEKKKEKKNPPLLYNLAEIQNDCSKMFKISPDETLRIIQELYEKKLVTYPRTDARVLSTAVAKEIHKNLNGLKSVPFANEFATYILENNKQKGLEKTRYVNDKQITDHYAIVPTGQGLGALNSLHPTTAKVYELIVRRFLSIFYPPATYQKMTLVVKKPYLEKEEFFQASFKVLVDEGYFPLLQYSFSKKKKDAASDANKGDEKVDDTADDKMEDKSEGNAEDGEDLKCDEQFLAKLSSLKKGMTINASGFLIKEGETSPPKRYTSGSLILAMENAGQLIEDEELRAQIKGQGIGTSATRAEILKKLVANNYLALAKKTQIITPTLLGELIYEVVFVSMKPLLDPKLTASWEKGLTLVADGKISEDEYLQKLNDFVVRRTKNVKENNYKSYLLSRFHSAREVYEGK